MADDEFELGVDQPDGEVAMYRRRVSRPSAVPWVLASLALVAAGVVVAPDDGLSMDGYPPGTIAMLAVDATAPPHEQWRTPIEGWQGGYRTLEVVDGTVVVLDRTAGTAMGLSLATGDQTWQHPIPTETCTVHEDVTCIEQPSTAGAVVLRIDPSSGRMDRTDLPYAVAAVGIGGDAVVLTQHEGDLELQRIDVDGGPRWVSTVDSTELMLVDDESLAGYVRLAVVGDRAYLAVGMLGMALEVTTGATTDPSAVFMYPTAYGNVLQSGDDPSVALLDDDGQVVFEGYLVVPDDDPAGQYDVTWDGRRFTVTSGTQVMWESERAELEYPAARVDGVLVTQTITSETTLTSRDLRTGEELWSAAAATSVLAAAGTTLLTAGPSDALAGVDVHNGETLWTYGATSPTGLVLQPDGFVLLLGGEIVRLAWERTG